MSQEAVEQILGRMLTDEQFRTMAVDSLEAVCQQRGYSLTTKELSLLSMLNKQPFTKLATQLDSGLCRA